MQSGAKLYADLLEELLLHVRAERELIQAQHAEIDRQIQAIQKLDEAGVPPHVWSRPVAMIREGTTSGGAVERARDLFRKRARGRDPGIDSRRSGRG